MGDRRPEAAALQAGDRLRPPRLISPVAGRPEVGGERQGAALWATVKPLHTTCFVCRATGQILALDIIFQVFLLEKGLIWRRGAGGGAGI